MIFAERSQEALLALIEEWQAWADTWASIVREVAAQTEAFAVPQEEGTL